MAGEGESSSQRATCLMTLSMSLRQAASTSDRPHVSKDDIVEPVSCSTCVSRSHPAWNDLSGCMPVPLLDDLCGRPQMILKDLKIGLKKDTLLNRVHPSALEEYNKTTRSARQRGRGTGSRAA